MRGTEERRRAWAPWALVLAGAALLGHACGGSDSPVRRDAGNDGGAVFPAADASASSGAGGSSGGAGGSSGGAGGASQRADGGAQDASSLAPDAAAGADGASAGDGSAGDASASVCRVTIRPVSPDRFFQLPAGADHGVRAAARVEGPGAPTMTGWRWTVTHDTTGPVTTAPVPGDPAQIEFKTRDPGFYRIRVGLSPPVAGCPDAEVTASAVPPASRVVDHFIRAVPPPGQNLAPRETKVLVTAGQPLRRELQLDRGFPVTIDPRDARDGALDTFYVLIQGRSASAARFEGYVSSTTGRGALGFTAPLDQAALYDLLIVPDGPDAGLPPLGFAGLGVAQITTTRFVLDAGHEVSGSVRTDAGPLPGARVRLRGPAFPSTIGSTDAAGRFTLRVRNGTFEARVLPPPDTGLPEAQLELPGGVAVPAAGGTTTLGFTYRALTTTRLDLTLAAPDGGPPAPLRVLVEGDPADLADVGTFSLAGGATHTSRGSLRLERQSTAAGTVPLPSLPRARYRVTVFPADAAGSAAITQLEVDLRASDTAARTLTLARKSRIVGSLTPVSLAAGRTVVALDAGRDGATARFTAQVDGQGRFALPADPGRAYRLFVEPAPDRTLPRHPLGEVRATGEDTIVARALPRALAVTGTVTTAGGPLPGTLVQIYCIGEAPECVDASAPDLETARPLDEVLSGADGSYRLAVPDPGF